MKTRANKANAPITVDTIIVTVLSVQTAFIIILL